MTGPGPFLEYSVRPNESFTISPLRNANATFLPRAGIEKETEGVPLVSTRHSAPQFPLHPYNVSESCRLQHGQLRRVAPEAQYLGRVLPESPVPEKSDGGAEAALSYFFRVYWTSSDLNILPSGPGLHIS
jgi:hypothetical protein